MDATDWKRVVDEYEQSRLTQRDFATRRKIDLGRLRYWIYRFRRVRTPALVPVRVVTDARPSSTVAAPEIELRIDREAIALRFAVGADPDYVARLAAALERLC